MIDKKDLSQIEENLWQIPQGFHSRMRVPARFYASEKTLVNVLKDESLNQLISGASLPGITGYALAMPDIHEGYSVPIGFVGAIDSDQGVISPGACGFDINCGMRVLTSKQRVADILPFLEKLANAIAKEVPSGLGHGHQVKLSNIEIDHILEGGAKYLVEKGFGVQDDLDNCETKGRLDLAKAGDVSQAAKSRGRDQVGTLGSGNHFIEVQKVVEVYDQAIAKIFNLFLDQIVIMIHCGSRGLGHQVCTDFLREFESLAERKYKLIIPNREFACVPFASPEGQRYFSAMAAAANYAWANRQMISYFIRKAWANVFAEAGGELFPLYDVAHNIIKREKHSLNNQEKELIIHRKGATRAFPAGHQELPEKYRLVGQPVLIPGSMGTSSYIMVGSNNSHQSFYSTNHGAGRVMSRHEAIRSVRGEQVIRDLKSKGIIVRCQDMRGIAEEAPMAYKDIDEIVEIVSRAGLASKVARLEPMAVIKGE